MESFLKEQLKRIQDLAEQMSSLESRLERHTAEISHRRESEFASVSYGPLADVRDLRTYKNANIERDTADERPRRHRTSRTSKRRRR